MLLIVTQFKANDRGQFLLQFKDRFFGTKQFFRDVFVYFGLSALEWEMKLS